MYWNKSFCASFRHLAILSCIASLLAFSALPANADPTGIEVGVEVLNLPGDGGGTVIFGSGPQPIMTTDGELMVDLHTHLLPSGSELIEIWLSTADGGPIAGDPVETVALEIWGLDWIDPATGASIPGVITENSLFVYFTIDGEPQPLSDPLSLNLPIVPDPLGRGFDVFVPGNDELDPHHLSVSTADLDPPAPFGLLALSLGLDASLINDIHVGFQVRHVPEPATGAFLAFGGMFLASVIRRRRR